MIDAQFAEQALKAAEAASCETRIYTGNCQLDYEEQLAAIREAHLASGYATLAVAEAIDRLTDQVIALREPDRRAHAEELGRIVEQVCAPPRDDTAMQRIVDQLGRVEARLDQLEQEPADKPEMGRSRVRLVVGAAYFATGALLTALAIYAGVVG
jgi:hypothetical protein